MFIWDFLLLVALVYLNPGFLYEKNANKKWQTWLCLFFVLNRRNIMFSYGHLSKDFKLSADSISLDLVSVMDYANRQLLQKQNEVFLFSNESLSIR